MIKPILENAITNIEAQRTAELQNAKNVAIREKINPFNAEIDSAFQKAVNELALKFEEEKKALLEAGNKKKQENHDKVMNEVTNSVAYKFDLTIAKLKKHIEELGE